MEAPPSVPVGTAGSPTTAVVSIQGVGSGTAVPVSGTVTANAGTNLNTSTLAVESGGHLASIDGKMAALSGGAMPVAIISGGTGGGAMTVADGADVTLGAKADAAITNPATSGSIMGVLRGILTAVNNLLGKGQATMANSAPVVIASDQGNLPVKAGFLEVAGSTTTTGTMLIADQDLIGGGYRSISVQITSIGGGCTYVFEGSNDDVTWLSYPLLNLSSTGGSQAVSSATAAGNIYNGPVLTRHFRVRCASIASGTITATFEASTMPYSPVAVAAASSIIGNVSVATQSGKVANQTFSGVQTVASLDTSLGSVTNHCSKAALGNVFAVYATNANAATRYLQLFNKASAPTSTSEVPVFSFVLPAGSATAQTSININESFFGQAGHMFAAGVAWGISTTPAVFTDSATAADHIVHVQWI